MSVDPRDSTAVAAALVSWATGRFAGPVALAHEPRPIGGGLDSYIHTIDLAGEALPPEWRRPLIVRLLPAPDRLPQARREAAVQAWAHGLGYPAPLVLVVLDPDDGGLGLPAQVMERAPGRPMLDVAMRPWRTGSMLDRLAGLAVRLHELPVDGFPVDPGQGSAVEHRLRLPRRGVEELHIEGLPAALAQLEAMAGVAMEGPQVVCHGDMHPLNLVVEGDHIAVVDWTNAGLGPREADVGRTSALFQFAEIGVDGRLAGAALRRLAPWLARRFERSYRRDAPLDAVQLARWKAIHTTEGWAQVELLRAGAFEGESSATVDQVPERVVAFLKQRSLELLGELGG